MNPLQVQDLPPADGNAASFESMFELAPVSLWVENYSALKQLFDEWRAQGITDLRAHLAERPAQLIRGIACVLWLRVCFPE